MDGYCGWLVGWTKGRIGGDGNKRGTSLWIFRMNSSQNSHIQHFILGYPFQFPNLFATFNSGERK